MTQEDDHDNVSTKITVTFCTPPQRPIEDFLFPSLSLNEGLCCWASRKKRSWSNIQYDIQYDICNDTKKILIAVFGHGNIKRTFFKGEKLICSNNTGAKCYIWKYKKPFLLTPFSTSFLMSWLFRDLLFTIISLVNKLKNGIIF